MRSAVCADFFVGVWGVGARRSPSAFGNYGKCGYDAAPLKPAQIYGTKILKIMSEAEITAANFAEFHRAREEHRLPRYIVRLTEDGICITFECPVCKYRRRPVRHRHGAVGGGHRVAHCHVPDAHPDGYELLWPPVPYEAPQRERKKP